MTLSTVGPLLSNKCWICFAALLNFVSAIKTFDFKDGLSSTHEPVFSDILIRFTIRPMLEKRARRHHRERLSEALREEIETILEGELADPRIGLVNVSEVHLAPDSRSARVFVVVQGNEEDGDRTLEGLNAARGYVRHELAERLKLRRPPELFFQVDRSHEYQARINDLLDRTKKRKR